jgi:hypothetical protein
MYYRLLLLPALLLTLAFTSCKKDAENEVEGDWLFPIAKGALSLNSLEALKNLNYHIEVTPGSINQPTNFVVSSPGIQMRFVGPFPIRITDWLHRLDVDTLAFSGTINNAFPIPIGAGTKVVMRTSRDTLSNANVAGSATIQTTVPPGGIFTFDIEILHKTLNDSIFFFLEDFNSPPYNNVSFTTAPTNLDVTLKVVTASLIEIYTNKTFSSKDTLEFDAGSDDQIGIRTGGSLSDTATTGVINVFADNGLPAHANVQLYFLDESRVKVIDSLFSPSSFKLEGGRTDGVGNPLYVASNAVKIPISRLKLDHIKLARYIVPQFTFNTSGYPGLFVSANKKPTLEIQLTGDLKLNIRF